jgi:cbb3-type cytochrome oxidase maturation protein
MPPAPPAPLIDPAMDILYLLIPLSTLLVLFILGTFGWAVEHDQFDDLEAEGSRILRSDSPVFDLDQSAPTLLTEECQPLHRLAPPRTENGAIIHAAQVER